MFVKGVTLCYYTSMNEGTINIAVCPAYHQAIELIGRRWTGAILQVMSAGASRFGDIAAAIPGLSARIWPGKSSDSILSSKAGPWSGSRLPPAASVRRSSLRSALDAAR